MTLAAVAGGGQLRVTHLLRLIKAEIRVLMALTGVTSVAEINPEALVA